MSKLPKDRFNHRYKTNSTPWELNRPDKNLVEIVSSHPIPPSKALDIGCGTGSNAIWLAENGFHTTGTDFSPLAIDQARARAEKTDFDIQFYEGDFLTQRVGEANFQFLFDRGCFHSFDDHEDRQAFARNANAHLTKSGLWLSFMGNSDAPPRDEGPPMRSATDITRAVEPWFKILFLKSASFDSERETPARSWHCLMQKRTV